MKAWRVILAALVIFAAGVVTGGLTVRLKLSQAPPARSAAAEQPRQRGEMLDRMQRQLHLTPDQRRDIERILRESNARMKQLWETVAPQAREEHQRVSNLIRAELRPEQLEKFEAMLKSRSLLRSHDERRRLENRRDQSPSRKSGGWKGSSNNDESPASEKQPTAE